MSRYLADLLERTGAAFASGYISVTGASAVNLWDIDQRAALGVGLGAALVSVLQGLIAKNVGDKDSAGFIGR